MKRRRLGPAGRTAILCAMGALSGLAMLVTVLWSLSHPESLARATRRAVPASVAIKKAHAVTLELNMELSKATHSTDKKALLEAAEALDRLTRDEATAWTSYVHHTIGIDGEKNLQRAYEQSAGVTQGIATEMDVLDHSDPRRIQLLVAAEEETAKQSDLLDKLEAVYESMITRGAIAALPGMQDAGRNTTILYVTLVVVFMAVGLLLMRGALRDQRFMTNEAMSLRRASERAEFEGALQRGLDMEPTEEGTFEVLKQALTMVDDQLPIAVLLADSSQAHMRPVISCGAKENGITCNVEKPSQCLAATSGHTRDFPDNRKLDACRYIRGAEERAWSVCVPVSVAGRASGVIHATGPIESQPSDDLISGLELVARKAGERIGNLRLLAKTEAQAQVDALTGLPNRRNLEDRIHDRAADKPFAVLFADLDHFKDINDKHGHEMGDRALRLFARVLSKCIRPPDMLGRFGGEEFVAVLPECTSSDAGVVAERIRSTLAEEIRSAQVPPFTVTIGIASGLSGEELADVVARADRAMLRGKTAGRDRVLLDEQE